MLKGAKITLASIALLAISARSSFEDKWTKEEFTKWQEETRRSLVDILYNGVVLEPVPLEPEFGKRETRINYELKEIKFQDRKGHITTGWLAKPFKESANKIPAIIALHGHGGSAYSCFDRDSMYYYGDFFARMGYVVLAIDIYHKKLEHKMPLVGIGPLPKNVKFPYMGQRVHMVRRAIDFLESEPYVDPEKIAIVGLSNGCLTAMFASSVDERIKLTIASGCLIEHERMWHSELNHCRCQYIYAIDGLLDYYDIFSLIAPRILIIQNGEQDPIFPIDSARNAFEHIKNAYEILGYPDNVIFNVHIGAHEFLSPFPSYWVEKYLPLNER